MISKRVRIAALRLDREHPGWERELIISDNGDMILHPCGCILGALFRGYFNAPENLRSHAGFGARTGGSSRTRGLLLEHKWCVRGPQYFRSAWLREQRVRLEARDANG